MEVRLNPHETASLRRHNPSSRFYSVGELLVVLEDWYGNFFIVYCLFTLILQS